jgi:hypothetical protein
MLFASLGQVGHCWGSSVPQHNCLSHQAVTSFSPVGALVGAPLHCPKDCHIYIVDKTITYASSCLGHPPKSPPPKSLIYWVGHGAPPICIHWCPMEGAPTDTGILGAKGSTR